MIGCDAACCHGHGHAALRAPTTETSACRNTGDVARAETHIRLLDRSIQDLGRCHRAVNHVRCTDRSQGESIREPGRIRVERFEGIKPMEMPGVLVANHGPFTWGENPHKAVNNAIALESVAQMAMGAIQINPGAPLAPKHLIQKHYLRKHGTSAYYGQST